MDNNELSQQSHDTNVQSVEQQHVSEIQTVINQWSLNKANERADEIAFNKMANETANAILDKANDAMQEETDENGRRVDSITNEEN